MQLGLASGSAEIVMCINVVAYRGKAASRGGQSTTGPAGGMAASGEDNSPKGPQGAWLPPEMTTHHKARRGQKCITGRTPINGPQGAKVPVMAAA